MKSINMFMGYIAELLSDEIFLKWKFKVWITKFSDQQYAAVVQIGCEVLHVSSYWHCLSLYVTILLNHFYNNLESVEHYGGEPEQADTGIPLSGVPWAW